MKNEGTGFPNQHLPQKAAGFLLFLLWLGVGSGLYAVLQGEMLLDRMAVRAILPNDLFFLVCYI